MSEETKDFLPEDKTKVVLTYFSQAQTLMMIAANKHPYLCEVCAKYNQRDEWSEIVGEIAAYCNVHMDGNYYAHELETLYVMLEERLSKMPVRLDMPVVVNEEDLDFSQYEHKLVGGK
jgi:protein associated with RNAse G/E